MTFDKSPQTIQTMFNMIAKKYDFINNVMSFGTQLHIKSECVKNLDIKPHDNILDLCCGTGDLAGIIKKSHPNVCVTGIDFSDKMLDIARKLSAGIPHVRVDLYNCDGKIYFGEMTFFHFSGMVPFSPHSWDLRFGDMLKLPSAAKN